MPTNEPVPTGQTTHTLEQIDAAVDDANTHIADSSIHMTSAEKTKLAGLENYDDTEVRGLITKDDAALAALVDGGAKNICQNNATTVSKNGVTATSNADGSITLSGSNSGGDFLLIYDLYNPSASASFTSNISAPTDEQTYICPATGNSSVRVQVMEYNSASDYTALANSDTDKTFTFSKNYVVFRIYIKSGANFTTNITIHPMVCAKAAWDISNAYQPYRPSWQELYEMVLALQGGNRSLSVQTAQTESDAGGEEEMR